VVGIGKTVEVEGMVFEIVRTIPITSLKDSITNDDIKQLARMYHAEKAFKSETRGYYFFVNEIQDIKWEDVVEEVIETIEQAEKLKEKE
jgi:hypothetical protein